MFRAVPVVALGVAAAGLVGAAVQASPDRGTTSTAHVATHDRECRFVPNPASATGFTAVCYPVIID